jgi:hypothetical protein
MIRLMRLLLLVPLAAASGYLTGCAAHRPTPPPPQDPRTGDAAWWIAKPAAASVVADDFTPLWRACRAAAIGASFTIDRVDFRGGLMTTLPQVSKQFFELWRNDVATSRDVLESSLDTIRRSVRFELRRLDDGRFEAVPKVIVERFSLAERRITTVARFAEIFTVEMTEGNRARDRYGGDLPDMYWYATGRDTALEKRLAESVRRGLRS